MPGEDQERFEDYLELERYIEELQAGHVAHPPSGLTPSQARIYRMAALFRSASPEGAEPRPEFVTELQARLEQELEQEEAETTQILPVQPEKRALPLQKRPGQVSRRRLLGGGAAIAASMVIGAGIDRVAEQTARGGSTPPPPTGKGGLSPNTAFIENSVPTIWHYVTTVAELGSNAVRFATDAVVGYVIRGDDDADPPDRGKIIAMSAACTHMGCIVQWQATDRKFVCPCHPGLFTEYGKVDNNSGQLYLYALPRMETKVEDGKIYVKVPMG
jgi:nitrite reductase/ring-hydroxylating ferredoxin subunit